MKVVKPQQLSVLTRPFEFRQRLYAGISVISMFPLVGEPRMLHEAEIWSIATEAMGDLPVLDEGIPKRRGEFLLCGHAYPLDEQRNTHSRVRLQLGSLIKELNIFGERYFDGDRILPPAPFERMPLDWKHAFGGEGFAYNPLGRGIRREELPNGGQAVCLPNVEYPGAMQALPGQRVAPACPGPIDIAWKQRMKHAGTYDSEWLKKHYPGVAPDIDWRFFNMASEDQQLSTNWRGDEPFQLEGVHPSLKRIAGALPGIGARCFLRRRGGEGLESVQCRLTTVWFFPDQDRLVLVHHGMALVEEPDASDLELIMLAAEWLDREKPGEFYAQVLERRLDKDKGLTEALRDSDLLPEDMARGYPFDPAALLKTNNNAYRARNLRERGEKRLAEGEAILEQSGFAIETEQAKQMMPVLPIPESIEELPEFFEKLEAEADRQLERVRKDGEASAARIDAAMAELGPEASKILAEVKANSGSPPRQTAAMMEAKLRADIEQLDLPPDQREQMVAELLSPAMKSLFVAREQSDLKQYHRSAHLTSAALAIVSAAESGQQLRQRVASGESCRGMDFTGADLHGADLSGADLDGVFLEGANLSKANLSGASLNGAVLARADLSAANLQGVKAVDVNLGKAVLRSASCKEAQFDRAIFADADLRSADFTAASMQDADLAGAELEGASFDGVSAEGLVFMDRSLAGVRWSGADLSKSAFLRVDLAEADFSKCRIAQTAFVRCLGHRASFVGAEMVNVAFADACDLTESNFSGARIVESNLRETCLDRSNFEGADLERSDFSGSSLKEAGLYRADARQSQWVKSDLRQADCRGANFMQANLERADLRGASLRGANLFQADLARIHVDRSTDFSDCLTKKMRIHPKRFREEVN